MNRPPMNPREMMAALRAMSDAGDDAPPARPDIRAQRLELLTRFARYAERHEFQPGDLVAEKEGLSTVKQANGGRALIYWRPLDPTDAVDALIIADAVNRSHANRLDCMIGSVETANDGTSTVLITAFDSARLRPLTPAERAELDAVRDAGGAA